MSKTFMTPTPGLCEFVFCTWPTRVHPPRTQSTMISQMIRSRASDIRTDIMQEGLLKPERLVAVIHKRISAIAH